MPLPKDIQIVIYNYCSNHLPSEEWYDEEFEFAKRKFIEALRDKKAFIERVENVLQNMEGE